MDSDPVLSSGRKGTRGLSHVHATLALPLRGRKLALAVVEVPAVLRAPCPDLLLGERNGLGHLVDLDRVGVCADDHGHAARSGASR
jgi:hypothetical protein